MTIHASDDEQGRSFSKVSAVCRNSTASWPCFGTEQTAAGYSSLTFVDARKPRTVGLAWETSGPGRTCSGSRCRVLFSVFDVPIKSDDAGDAPELEDPLPLAAGEDAAPARPRLSRLGTGPSDNLASTAGHVAVPWMSWITSNPLAGLPSLPKLHYMYPYPSCAVPPESCGNASTWPKKNGKPAPDPGNISRVNRTLKRELLVDTARILGSLPVPNRNDPTPGTAPALSAAQYDTLVGVAEEAARARGGVRPVLTITYSPWYSEVKW